MTPRHPAPDPRDADPLTVWEEETRRFEWAGWLAHMDWPARAYWLVVVPRMRHGGLVYRVLAPVRAWAAERWVEAYMAWKTAGYSPASWPR